MSKKAMALTFCKANVSAETLKAFHAPGIKEALLSNCTARVAFAESGAGKTDALSRLQIASTTGGSREQFPD